MQLARHQSNELLYVGFNQTYECISVGTDSGFRIYNVEPFKETFQRDFSRGGIGESISDQQSSYSHLQQLTRIYAASLMLLQATSRCCSAATSWPL